MRRKLALAMVGAAVIALILGATFYLPSQGPKGLVLTIASKPRAGPYITEFPTQSSDTVPNAIAVDAHGSVWFVLQNLSSLAELNPSNGTIREFLLPSANGMGALAWGVAVDDSRGLVWFTEQVSDAVWSFNVATSTFTRHHLSSPNSYPFGLALDRKGDVWFTEIGVGKIGEITASGAMSEHSIPLGLSSRPAGITVDSSGVVWFTLSGLNQIGSFSAGKFQFYDLNGHIDVPTGIATDGKGNIWVTMHGSNLVGEFNPASHYFRSISTSVPPLNTSLPYFDAVDSGGNIWFNEHYGNAITEFIPESSTLIEYVVPTRVAYAQNISGSMTMNLSPNGTPWFTEYYAGRVGTLDRAAKVPLGMGIQGNEGLDGNAVRIASNGSATISLYIDDNSSSPASLVAAVGNLTRNYQLPFHFAQFNFAFSFAKNTGIGNFNDTLTITSKGSARGTYYFTIGVGDGDVIVSRVIQVEVG